MYFIPRLFTVVDLCLFSSCFPHSARAVHENRLKTRIWTNWVNVGPSFMRDWSLRYGRRRVVATSLLLQPFTRLTTGTE